MFTHQQKREPALMQGNNSRETVFWLAVTEFSLSPCVFVGVGLLTLAWQLLGASWLGGTVQRFLHSYTSSVLGSDDWHSANSHQRLPNNGARALMNVIVMLDPHNIWKPPCWDLPWPLSLIEYNKYFPLLYCSPNCIGALAMFGHRLISVNIADKISGHLYVFRKIRNQAIVL